MVRLVPSAPALPMHSSAAAAIPRCPAVSATARSKMRFVLKATSLSVIQSQLRLSRNNGPRWFPSCFPIDRQATGRSRAPLHGGRLRLDGPVSAYRPSRTESHWALFPAGGGRQGEPRPCRRTDKAEGFTRQIAGEEQASNALSRRPFPVA